MNKQTAVEWLIEKLTSKPISDLTDEEWFGIMGQAKAMEKEQIVEAFVECWQANMPDGYECKLGAVEYYNETYGGNK